jgi:hypothetical protein
MSKSYRTQAAALALSTLVTLGLMIGLDLEAAPPSAQALMARQAPPATQVSAAAACADRV